MILLHHKKLFFFFQKRKTEYDTIPSILADDCGNCNDKYSTFHFNYVMFFIEKFQMTAKKAAGLPTAFRICFPIPHLENFFQSRNAL